MPHAIDHAALVQRIADRRGGIRSIYPRPDPARTAHLVVDMQNGFMQVGAPVEVPMAREVVEPINRISAAVRAAGGTNIFLRYTTAEGDTAWPVFMQRMGVGAAPHREAFTPGNPYWDLWPTLDVQPEDVLIDKRRFSGFTPGTCPLHTELQEHGTDTLIVTGTLTNCCCESTVRDAMQHNYKVLMATDANAALTDEEHEAALYSLGWIFADLYTSEEVVGLLGRA
ncbi:MAG: isochorismatase family cysteine hydrolase [Croceibacterium sp.]